MTAALLAVLLVHHGGNKAPERAAEAGPARDKDSQPVVWTPEIGRRLGIPPPPDWEAPQAGAPAVMEDSTIYERTVPSVVIIRTFRGGKAIGLGSGFVLHPGNRIVTNEHVIRGASLVRVFTNQGKSGDVTQVIALDERRDIAVLPIPKRWRNAAKWMEGLELVAMPALRLAVVPPKIGDTVFALGSPKGLDFTFTKGIVSQFRRNFGSFGSVVQTDANLSPGSSGGPLVDCRGQVVGINTLASRAVTEAHNLNFAVSAEEIATVCGNQRPTALSGLRGFSDYEEERLNADGGESPQVGEAAPQPRGDSDWRTAGEVRRILDRALADATGGEFDKAIADYTDAIRLDPKCALAYCGQGIAYWFKGDYDKAIADFTEAIRLDPNYANAYRNRGLAYKSKHDYDKAIADYTEAIRLEPKNARAYYERGCAYVGNGDDDHANADLAKAQGLGYKP